MEPSRMKLSQNQVYSLQWFLSSLTVVTLLYRDSDILEKFLRYNHSGPLPSYLLNLQSLLLQDTHVVCFQRDVFYLLTNYYAVVFNAVTTCIFLKMFLIAFFLLAIFVLTGFRNVLLGCALSALFSFWEWNQYISPVSFPCVNLCKATIGLDQFSKDAGSLL